MTTATGPVDQNLNHIGNNARLLRYTAYLHELQLDSIIYNRSAVSVGTKVFFVKVGYNSWKMISEAEAVAIVERSTKSHIRLVPDSDSTTMNDFEKIFPHDDLYMPVWIYYNAGV